MFVGQIRLLPLLVGFCSHFPAQSHSHILLPSLLSALQTLCVCLVPPHVMPLLAVPWVQGDQDTPAAQACAWCSWTGERTASRMLTQLVAALADGDKALWDAAEWLCPVMLSLALSSGSLDWFPDLLAALAPRALPSMSGADSKSGDDAEAHGAEDGWEDDFSDSEEEEVCALPKATLAPIWAMLCSQLKRAFHGNTGLSGCRSHSWDACLDSLAPRDREVALRLVHG